MGKIIKFTDLIVWKKAHAVVLEIYYLTKTFPQEEKYGLSDQMRRSAISITSNIAEGFSRIYKKEKKQFYYIALGSVTELENQLLVGKDVGYISQKKFMSIAVQLIEVHKLLNNLIKSIKIP